MRNIPADKASSITCSDLAPRDRARLASTVPTAATLLNNEAYIESLQLYATRRGATAPDAGIYWLGSGRSEIIPEKKRPVMSSQMGLNMADNLFTRMATAYTEGSTAESSKPPVFIVCDVNTITADTFARDVATRFPGVLVQVADSPSDLAQRAETIFTMLPSSPQVKDVYLGDKGILQGITKRPEPLETLCVDSTTLDVSVAKDVAAKIEATGTDMVDAPVSGGVVGARAATLSFMVGGSDAAYTRAHPFLSLMGRNIVHCGPSGSGLTAKICNNLVLGIQQIAVAEAMLLGTRLGLDPSMLAGVINTSTGRCWSSEVNNPVPGSLPGKSPPCETEYHGGFASKLMQKDMALAQHAASSVGTPLPLGDAAEAIYTQMNQDGDQKFADRDFSVVYEYLRRQAVKKQM